MGLSIKSIAPVLIALIVPVIGYIGFSDRFAFLLGTSTDNATFRRELVELRAPVTGQITAVNVDDGDHAPTGSTLVLIEQRQVDFDVDNARLESRVFRSRMSANVRSASASRSRIAGLRKAALHCDRSLDLLGEQLKRAETLAQRGFVSRSSLDTIQADYEQRQSDCLGLAADAAAEQRQLGAIEADLGTMTVQYQGANNQSRKGLDEADRGRVRTPFPAIVGNRRVAVGMTVQAGTPLLTLVSSQRVWIEASFREDQLGGVRVGTPVTAVADALKGHVFKGRIAAIGGATVSSYATAAVRSNAGTFTRLTQWVPLRIALEQDPLIARLPAGASCQVSI